MRVRPSHFSFSICHPSKLLRINLSHAMQATRPLPYARRRPRQCLVPAGYCGGPQWLDPGPVQSVPECEARSAGRIYQPSRVANRSSQSSLDPDPPRDRTPHRGREGDRRSSRDTLRSTPLRPCCPVALRLDFPASWRWPGRPALAQVLRPRGRPSGHTSAREAASMLASPTISGAARGTMGARLCEALT